MTEPNVKEEEVQHSCKGIHPNTHSPPSLVDLKVTVFLVCLLWTPASSCTLQSFQWLLHL